MTAAHPLADDDGLDVFPMDDAYVAQLPSNVRDAILAAERGAPEVASHAEVVDALKARRPRLAAP